MDFRRRWQDAEWRMEASGRVNRPSLSALHAPDAGQGALHVPQGRAPLGPDLAQDLHCRLRERRQNPHEDALRVG